jgi:hypothetical protein
MLGLLSVPPRNFRKDQCPLPNQVAEGDIVSALHDYMRSRADRRAGTCDWFRQNEKSPGAVAGAFSQGELKSDQ